MFYYHTIIAIANANLILHIILQSYVFILTFCAKFRVQYTHYE